MSALKDLLSTYRKAAVTEREKGTYFEELICAYLRNEGNRRSTSINRRGLDRHALQQRQRQQVTARSLN